MSSDRDRRTGPDRPDAPHLLPVTPHRGRPAPPALPQQGRQPVDTWSTALPGSTGQGASWRTRWGAPALQLLAVSALLLVGSGVVDSMRAAIAADVAADSGAGPRVPIRAAAHRVPPPVSVTIPKLHVSSSLVDLHERANGTLQVPTDFARAGWWADGPRPGDPAPAVVVGHVDSFHGPGVFYRLATLAPGDLVEVRRADRSTARFVVQKVLNVEKRAFPTALVYGGHSSALRLITCGGAFDRHTGHYLSNTVVFAVPQPAARPSAPLRRTVLSVHRGHTGDADVRGSAVLPSPPAPPPPAPPRPTAPRKAPPHEVPPPADPQPPHPRGSTPPRPPHRS